MKPRLQVSRAAIELIKRCEGYRRTAAQAPDGRWTIGYGHTLTARHGAQVSESDAEALLMYDLIAVAHAVNEWTYTPLTQNEFDALASFAFSVGLESFRGSAVLRRLNEGAHLQAACAMELWRRAEVEGEHLVIDALVRRRAVEKALFLTPAGAWLPAPSAILKPSLDLDLAGAVPHETPATVETSMEGDLVLLRRDIAAFPNAAPAEPDAHPATAAAEAVTSRLATIFREPEAAPQAVPLGALPAAANDRTAAAAAEVPEAQPEADLDRAEIAPAEAAALDLRALAPLGVLAALGLGLFVGGLYWAFRFAPAAGVSPSGALGVGWLAGVAGVGFFSLAAYRLFERLGRAGEDDALGG